MGERGRPKHPDVLTPREWEVVSLLREGRSNEEIAGQLGISLAGAKYHVSEILSKLGVSSREDAAKWRPAGSRRPPWAHVLAPVGWMVLQAKAPKLAAAASLAIVAVVAVGTGTLVWGLLRTSSADSLNTQNIAQHASVATIPPRGISDGLPSEQVSRRGIHFHGIIDPAGEKAARPGFRLVGADVTIPSSFNPLAVPLIGQGPSTTITLRIRDVVGRSYDPIQVFPPVCQECDAPARVLLLYQVPEDIEVKESILLSVCSAGLALSPECS
ncbi:MAG: helix-turn-helix transcriptional regulator [Dehalococcoidia bacterium]